MSKLKPAGDPRLTLKEIAKFWKCSVSLCRQLCEEKRVSGANRIGGALGGGLWLIPKGTKKPPLGKRGRPKGSGKKKGFRDTKSSRR